MARRKAISVGITIFIFALVFVVIIGQIDGLHWGAFTPLDLLFSSLLLGLLALIGWTTFRGRARIRRIRAAVLAGDDAQVPPMAVPDLALALVPGTSLTLARRRTGWGNYFAIALTFAYLPGIVIVSQNNTITDIAPLTAMFLWPGLLIVLFLLLILLAAYLIDTSRVTITIDDQGVRVRNLVTRQALAWQDIRGILALPTLTTGVMARTYHLIGVRRKLDLTFAESELSFTQRRFVRERFIGGTAAYEAGMQRVLATLVARTGQPIRRYPLTLGQLTPTQRAIFSIPNAPALPLAPPELQPPAFIPDAEYARTGRLILRPRLPWFGIIFGTCAATLGLLVLDFGLVIIMYGIQGSSANGTTLNDYLISFAILLPCFLLLFGLPAWALVRALRLPVRADDAGLQRGTQMIAWQAVRGWALIPHPGRPHLRTYIIYGNFGRITWNEHATYALAGRGIHGDRHAAYRARAELLHALIATRTGQPLRRMP